MSKKPTAEEMPVCDKLPDEMSEEEMAANVDAVMKKYDRESNVRIWEGSPKWVVTCVLAAFSLFCAFALSFLR